VRFQSRGCEGKDANGCLAISTAYRDGVGMAKDPDKAYTFADRACGMHSAEACDRVALFMISGAGVTKDVKGGIAKLDTMCTHQEALGVGCGTLADLYAGGSTSDVPANALLHQEYMKKACLAGSKDRCDRDKLDGTVDSARIFSARGDALFQSKCDAGDLMSCALFGELLVARSSSVDREKGIALLRKACDGKVDRACKKLAEVSQ
jgi:TPR repeat protein